MIDKTYHVVSSRTKAGRACIDDALRTASNSLAVNTARGVVTVTATDGMPTAQIGGLLQFARALHHCAAQMDAEVQVWRPDEWSSWASIEKLDKSDCKPLHGQRVRLHLRIARQD